MTPRYYPNGHGDDIICWCIDRSSWETFRENGPCMIYSHGTVYFSQTNTHIYNRRAGPVKIYPDGRIDYLNQHNMFHRTAGPALIYADGSKEYWVDGHYVSSEEFFLKYGVL